MSDRPAPPARPKDAALVTAFHASLERAWMGGTTDGRPIIKFAVSHEDKWMAMRLDEAVGYELYVEIRKTPGPDPDLELDKILGEA